MIDAVDRRSAAISTVVVTAIDATANLVGITS